MKEKRRSFRLAEHYAHRGYHDKPAVPENSMAAFRRAVEHGLASEIDVHLIADGTLVVFHDDDLERETGVKGSIEAYDLTNLRKLRLEGTDEKIAEVKAALEAGTTHVFDTSAFTVGGKTLTSYMADVDTDAAYEGDTEVISDGYFHESEYRSAPYFDLRIDGITLLDEKY